MTLLEKDRSVRHEPQRTLPCTYGEELDSGSFLQERRGIAPSSNRQLHEATQKYTKSHGVHVDNAARLAAEKEVPHTFRSRRPPKKEVQAKLFVLFVFGAFCTFVGFNVAHLPLPSARHDVAGSSLPTDKAELITLSNSHSEERFKFAKHIALTDVPYLMPWHEEEHLAMLFIWRLLYRSLKTDLDQFEAHLRNISPVGTTVMRLGGSAKHELPKAIIEVVEAHAGYITTSLAHFLSTTYVFSVVASAPTVQRYGRDGVRRGYTRGADSVYDSRKEDLAADRRAHALKVAAIVERVLANPAADRAVEGSYQPHSNALQPTLHGDIQRTSAKRTGNSGGSGEGSVAQGKTEAATATWSSSHFCLCVPRHDLNFSYYINIAAQGLRVNYQVVLSPHIALRSARTVAEFDGALRALLTQANVASFIALPWLSKRNSARTDRVDNSESARQRSSLPGQELVDYESWYGDSRPTPLQVLQRTLRGPEVETQYTVLIVPLGSRWWSGGLSRAVPCGVEEEDARAASYQRDESFNHIRLRLP
nr:unnamed protein product [Leishmania braziliensis]